MGIHWQELVIILVIALVIFGPRRLPEVGRSLGSGIKEFRDSFSGKSDNESGKPVAAPVAVPVEAQPVIDVVTKDSGPTA
jgi:sec-independent protein translocase protein TatA